MASDMKSAMFLVDNGLFIPSTAPASMLCTPHDGQSFEGEALELTFASDVVLYVFLVRSFSCQICSHFYRLDL